MNCEVYQRKNDRAGKTQWYWRLTSTNGKLIAESGEGYDDVKKCYAGIRRVNGSSAMTAFNLVTGESVLVIPTAN